MPDAPALWPPGGQIAPGIEGVFISYDEPGADAGFKHARAVLGPIGRVHGMRGIAAAHRAAGAIASAPRVLVLDGDSWVLPTLAEDLAALPETDRLVLWHARQPHLPFAYGVGGAKLFSRAALLARGTGTGTLDHSRERGWHGPGQIGMPRAGNENRFNRSPAHAWRGGFREAAKLWLMSRDEGATCAISFLFALLSSDLDAENGGLIRLGAYEGLAMALEAPAEAARRLVNDYPRLSEMAAARSGLGRGEIGRRIARGRPRLPAPATRRESRLLSPAR